MASDTQHCVRALRLKVKREGYAWLDAAAIEVNQVWNYANATSYKAARPFAGTGKWLSAFDLDKLTPGATEYFERIGSETIQRVNAEFATRRRQFKRAKLRWRVSRGSKRSLGWVPLKAAQLILLLSLSCSHCAKRRLAAPRRMVSRSNIRKSHARRAASGSVRSAKA